MDALAFLDKPATALKPLYVVHGDEAFLRRLTIEAIRTRTVGDDDSAVSVFPGDKAEFAAVFDELMSAPFFAPKRVVVVADADPFVTRYRSLLEKKVAGELPSTGLLILDVRTWPSNTRLAKLVDDVIVCKAPTKALPGWVVKRTRDRHGKEIPAAAAELLVELVGPEMGLLDQEIEKLAIYVGDRQRIEAADVDKLVGSSRAEDVWKILDLVGQGKPAESLRILQRSLEKGEEPMRLIGLLASQLRKLAQAARRSTTLKMPLSQAIAQAGIPPFALRGAEQQLRHLTRARALHLYDMLLELNLDIRGNSPLPIETLLERFLLRLAAPAPVAGPG
jgi:DNA polymerase-3 subunit delta